MQNTLCVRIKNDPGRKNSGKEMDTMGIFDEMNDRSRQEETSRAPKHIKGIVCDVRNCAYHDSDSYCTAEKISVGPSYACSCTDTVCATFKQKQN